MNGVRQCCVGGGSWRELPQPVSLSFRLPARGRSEGTLHRPHRTFLQDRTVAAQPRLRQLRALARGARGLAGHAQARPAISARPHERAHRLRRARERLPLRGRERGSRCGGASSTAPRAARAVVQRERDSRAHDDAPAARRARRRRRAGAPSAAADRAARRHARGRCRRVARAAPAHQGDRHGAAPRAEPTLRTAGLGAAAAQACVAALFQAQRARGERARGLAAAAGELPRDLVSRRLVPRERRPAPLCARRGARCAAARPARPHGGIA